MSDQRQRKIGDRKTNRIYRLVARTGFEVREKFKVGGVWTSAHEFVRKELNGNQPPVELILAVEVDGTPALFRPEEWQRMEPAGK